MQNIETWWGERPNLYGTKMYQFQQRLKHIKLQLKKWNKEVFGNIFEEKNRLETEMETIQRLTSLGISIEEINERENQIRMELDKQKLQEEVLWKQKSRI
jgi:hypothetical protein